MGARRGVVTADDGEGLGGWWAPGDGDVGVLIVPSIFGSDAGTRDLAADLAVWGAPVALPDLFHRVDPGPCGFDEAGTQRALARMRAYDRARGVKDLDAWVRFLRQEGGARAVVALGICFGGHLAVLLNAEGVVDGVVTVHGGGIERTLGLAERMRAPMSLHFGDADPSIPSEALDAIRHAFVDRDDVEVVVHAGAAHGFAHPGHRSFQPAASTASRKALRDLMGRLAAG